MSFRAHFRYVYICTVSKHNHINNMDKYITAPGADKATSKKAKTTKNTQT